MKMNKLGALITTISVVALLSACSNTPKLASQPMPKSGFLPNYSVLVPTATSESDTRIWRYRKAGVNPGAYTAVILDPIYLNQSATKDVSAYTINQKTKTLDFINKVPSNGDHPCFVAINKKGEVGAYSLQKGFNFSVYNNTGNHLNDASYLF